MKKPVTLTLSNRIEYYSFVGESSSLDGLEFEDILPADPRYYDKMQPPKKGGKATVVLFHVFVNGIDSIDEYSMVSDGTNVIISQFRGLADVTHEPLKCSVCVHFTIFFFL